MKQWSVSEGGVGENMFSILSGHSLGRETYQYRRHSSPQLTRESYTEARSSCKREGDV